MLKPKPQVRPKSAKPVTSASDAKKPDKKKKKRTRKEPYVEPPSVDMVLRYPVELWVSCGEGFVKPESKNR